ncbi:mannose-6-phosphate isomerase, class I [Virgibacillus sp. DJP39]|uniref:mannose-6-phosphate isomerase, class I n=1 Tax=Virgibacillus sp. DJP39 TaxID=3409790 RepID=UPI003BB75FB3
MYNKPIFLQPVFKERIWGGQKLLTEYKYDIPHSKIGEAWVISAHSNGPSVILNGPLEGKTLADAWNEHGELFNRKESDSEDYPLLVKILDANADLSVQVHPDDIFATEIEGQPYGKTECWYVLNADPNSEIILGHHAKTRQELGNMIDQNEWSKLLKRVKVNAGDFIHVPSGTIHAIGKGIVILETQQSSDITYRVYDYDRVDADGKTRALHLERAKEVTLVPHQVYKADGHVKIIDGLMEKTLVREKYFTVYLWELDGKVMKKLTQDFLQVSVIEGKGVIAIDNEKFSIEKGNHFVLPSTVKTCQLSGKATLIVSHK